MIERDLRAEIERARDEDASERAAQKGEAVVAHQRKNFNPDRTRAGIDRKFCSRHMHDMADRLKHLGLWRLARPEEAAQTAALWLAGRLPREKFDPMVVLMLELQAKADRMADPRAAALGKPALAVGCALCNIQKLANGGRGDAAADVKVIRGMGDLMLGIAKSNGLVR